MRWLTDEVTDWWGTEWWGKGDEGTDQNSGGKWSPQRLISAVILF